MDYGAIGVGAAPKTGGLPSAGAPTAYGAVGSGLLLPLTVDGFGAHSGVPPRTDSIVGVLSQPASIVGVVQ
jgi:hypothetical protein